MKTILTGFFFFATIAAFSQAANSQYDIYSRTIDINQKSLAFGLTEAEFEAIKDNAYANSSFLNGSIFQGEQLIRSAVPMRYNTYADEIEIKQSASDETYSALIKDPEIFVKIGREIYQFIPFQGSNEKGGYFTVLADGNTYDLYKKTSSVFVEAKKAETNYTKDTPPSFSKTVKYYLVKDGTFLEMPNSKSRILKMMDQKKSEMKTYIKENKLDIDKESDLIQVISHFDSLL